MGVGKRAGRGLVRVQNFSAQTIGKKAEIGQRVVGENIRKKLP